MDEYTIDLFNPPQEMAEHETNIPKLATTPPTPSQQDADTSDWPLLTGSKGLRDRVASLGRTTLQDRLVEKLLQQVIPDSENAMPSDDVSSRGYPQDKTPTNPTERPNFNLTTMSNNFRRFNARIGVVFQFQDRVVRLLTWQHPTCTLSFLSIYTFVCLDPYLLAALPPAALLLTVLIPAFLARHPAPPKGTLSSEQSMGYSPRGPPLAPAPTVRPAKELSKDFFHNIRDLQNCMDDFSNLHDSVVALLQPLTNFSDESLSSALFLGLTLAALLLTITASLIPWRFLSLAVGWFVFLGSHPALAPSLARAHETHVAPHQRRAASRLRAFAASDIILDSAPETREVEIFELQRASATSAEWEPWLFSPSPYDPLSAPRIAGQRPRGTRFFEDVLPPEGWEWSEKKWALDLWSREWVEERIITGVEVETEGERWVYDMYDEREAQAAAGLGGDGGVGEGRAGVVDFSRIGASVAGSIRGGKKGRTMPLPSWEEGEDGEGRRGEWRRRRWVRLVRRPASPSNGES